MQFTYLSLINDIIIYLNYGYRKFTEFTIIKIMLPILKQ